MSCYQYNKSVQEIQPGNPPDKGWILYPGDFPLFILQDTQDTSTFPWLGKHDLSSGLLVSSYLIAPSTMPCMICFCANRKIMIIGTIASSAADRIRSHCFT